MANVWRKARALMLASVLALPAGLPSPVSAGLIILQDEGAQAREARRFEQEMSQVAADLFTLMRDTQPALARDLLPRHDVDRTEDCPLGAAPRVFAILVGVNEYPGFPERAWLRGPENDVDLLRRTLSEAGAADEDLFVLSGPAATRAALADAFGSILDRVQCNDRVFFHVAGYGLVGGQDLALLAGRQAHAPLAERIGALLDAARESDPEDMAIAVETAMSQLSGLSAVEADLLEGYLRHGLHGGRNRAVTFIGPDPDSGRPQVFYVSELAKFAQRVRARGAHAIAALDIDHAAGVALLDWVPDRWGFVFGRQEDLPAAGDGASGVRTGELVAFYATDADGTGIEMPLPRGAEDATIFGLFTFLIASALQDDPTVTPARLASSFADTYRQTNRTRPHFTIEATDPHLPLLPPATREAPQAGAEAIRILSPAPTRGATAVADERVTVEGIVLGDAPVIGVFVNDRESRVAPDGRFEAEVALATGLNRVTVRAVTAEPRLHQATLELTWQGDLQALEGERRRFAVTIANQDYDRAATGFSSLVTPIADARAVAEVLGRRFGFVTEATDGRGTFPLMLEDPDQRTILRTLNRLAEVAGPRDEVLIFYAGHGRSDPQLGSAAWVPADAEAGFPDSFLASSTLSNALRRFQAGNLILIVDSCYAGGMFRAGETVAEAMAADETRITALLRQQARRSRVLITSGNDEPVLDLGGAGHSVFARALLIGLEEMNADAFGARELFERHLRVQVSGLAAQEPQLRDLLDVGHEGGDFVFVRADNGAKIAPGAAAPPPSGPGTAAP